MRGPGQHSPNLQDARGQVSVERLLPANSLPLALRYTPSSATFLSIMYVATCGTSVLVHLTRLELRIESCSVRCSKADVNETCSVCCSKADVNETCSVCCSKADVIETCSIYYSKADVNAMCSVYCSRPDVNETCSVSCSKADVNKKCSYIEAYS